MAQITGRDRSQTLLLPESLDNYVNSENPVRFVEAFVDGLDLAAAGFARVQSKETGHPGYAPADLLKLYIYMDTSTASDRAAGSKPRPPAISR
jgi:transposase